MQRARVLIIGGGAAGLLSAIAAARLGVDVTILEADARVGRKILASGNGRCNLSNLSASPAAFNQAGFVTRTLAAYNCEDIRFFFGELGLLTRADDEGRVYPTTNSAGSVLDVLRLECAHLGVNILCGFDVQRIVELPDSGGFDVLSDEGEAVHGDTVVVTTGGGGALLADSGHEMVERVPVLGPLKTDTDRIRGLSGVRVRCGATILVDVDDDNTGGRPVATERGELLFRDYGVSGIMIFDLSRHVEDRCSISIDFFPDATQGELQEMIEHRCGVLAWRTTETFFSGMLHDRVARAVLSAAGIDARASVDTLDQARLAALLKDFRLTVTGRGDAAQSQVTRGGAAVAGFDPETMQSRLMDGLFAAGEVLDVDGRSGGFNLHWAWASGIVAGEEAARSALARRTGRTSDPEVAE